MLPAQDHWPQPGRFQSRPAIRHESHGDRRQRQKVREPEHVEIDLVDGIHPLLKAARHQNVQLWKIPGHGDAERRQQIGKTDPLRDRRQDNARHSPGAAERAPRGEHEQQLPGKRIEGPVAVRICAQIPVVMQGERIERHRERQREIGSPLHQPQDNGKKKHQHDIERQHVDVQWAKSQEQGLKQDDAGLLEEIHDAHFLGVKGVVGTDGGVENLREEDDDDEHMRDIDLPDPPQDAHARDHESGRNHRTAVDERRRVARDENENLGGVAEAVTADREPGQ